MSSSPSTPDVPLPRWALVVGSLVVACHLLALATNVLAAPSGPWPTMEGMSQAPPPQFAQSVAEPVAQPYLRLLKMTHNYHFPSNRPGGFEAFLEVRLFDDQGREMKTLRLPDPDASAAVRRQQALLARWMTDDMPVLPPQAEKVYPKDQEAPRVSIWEGPPQGPLAIRTLFEHELRSRGPAVRPSDWSVLLAKSYARYLCREHGATSADVIRHSRGAIPPTVLFDQEPRPGPAEDLLSNYGRLPR
jgi:hypothetical protein